MEDYQRALAAFGEAVAADVQSETMRVLALLHGGQSAAQLESWDQSLKWLTRLIEQFPESPYVTEAVYERGWALQNLQRLDEAGQCYQQVIEASRGELGARARFMLGELYFGQKDFQNAIREFRLLIYGYGGDAAPDEIKPWQAKGGLEAGRCAAILAGQANTGQQRATLLANARKYLGYVAEKHPNSPEAVAAAQQLKKYGT
jgi:tetratricopeptide (TPR) repeat protein